MKDESPEFGLVLALLCGYVEYDGDHLPQHHYLIDAGQETTARVYLANLLRGPGNLSQQLREILAALFDPEPNKHPAVEREILFKRRRSGRTNDAMRKSVIAGFIWNKVKSGQSAESAVLDASIKYKLERSRIFEIWGAYRPLLERISNASPTNRGG
jgi:hypothetical protein